MNRSGPSLDIYGKFKNEAICFGSAVMVAGKRRGTEWIVMVGAEGVYKGAKGYEDDPVQTVRAACLRWVIAIAFKISTHGGEEILSSWKSEDWLRMMRTKQQGNAWLPSMNEEELPKPVLEKYHEVLTSPSVTWAKVPRVLILRLRKA